MPKPVASFGREADASSGADDAANRGCSSTAVLEVRAADCSDPSVTSVTVSLWRMISIVSPGVKGSGTVGAGVSRANFAASSIVSRSCAGAHGFVRKRNTSLSLIEPSTASRSA